VSAKVGKSASFVVFNKTRETIIASDAMLAQTIWQRTKGLLGRSLESFNEGKGLWILPCEGIHTLGMSYPIDVAYLDKSRRVLHLYHKLKPFRIGAISLGTHSVLELPAGTLSRTNTGIGDVLDFQPRMNDYGEDMRQNPSHGIVDSIGR
jgi:uncharacterized protein